VFGHKCRRHEESAWSVGVGEA